MTKEIPLSRGLVALVSDEDYERVNEFKWYAAALSSNNESYYAGRTDQYGRTTFLHRFVVNAKPGQVVDHINRIVLDNRRENLRICDKSTDSQNRRKRTGTSSKYRGVTWVKTNRRYKAQIVKNKRLYYLGSFKTEEEAARAYDNAALHHFGEFACLNFPATSRPPSGQ